VNGDQDKRSGGASRAANGRYADIVAVRQFLQRSAPRAALRGPSENRQHQSEAAASGLGVAALSCYLGDSDARLVRLRPDPLPAGLSLWVLTHADLRRTARIRAFSDFLVDALSRERDLLEGRRPFGRGLRLGGGPPFDL
jgi:DNA-binding transcriptional LysR family regulator